MADPLPSVIPQEDPWAEVDSTRRWVEAVDGRPAKTDDCDAVDRARAAVAAQHAQEIEQWKMDYATAVGSRDAEIRRLAAQLGNHGMAEVVTAPGGEPMTQDHS